jgi:hypothetical protein
MAQYPIPQFIEEEGKIMPFLTFRQFFWLIGGGAISFMLYFTLPFGIFAILGLLVMGITAALAFVKINNASIITVVLNFIGFATGPKSYVWKRKEFSYPDAETECC